ncbi:uncharacterized protein LOC134324617 isoform X2 [Trichomycterus rosablanca]|uniref:uncharacterized protein LOC134324617 isoform X2 n=1 Tax=Trichomycterus rosablanca TaxID=2290929 RepID=UPI002F35EAFC
MSDESGLVNLNNFLFQLALEIRESIQKKDEVNQQVQICKGNIKEKKNCIDETQKSINKLDEDILRKQKTVKCYKENVKRKMFQDRIESYWKVFQQHKEEFCQNPLATKLLKIQAENEEIEKRIRATEELIHAKEKKLNAWKGDCSSCDSGRISAESNEAERSSHQDPEPQVTEPEQEAFHIDLDNQALENNEDDADGNDESVEPHVGVSGSTVWSRPERKCEQAAEENEREDENMNPLGGAEILEEVMEDGSQKTAGAAVEGCNEGAASPTSSPVRMLDVPTFALNSSPSTSAPQQERPETPAFVFSINSRPGIPAFSGLGCGFDPDPSQHEESPFNFTSSYFSNKKSPEPKLPGFLFDGSECRTEEDFSFNFESPRSSSSTQEAGGTGDSFSFPFSFGKF